MKKKRRGEKLLSWKKRGWGRFKSKNQIYEHLFK